MNMQLPRSAYSLQQSIAAGLLVPLVLIFLCGVCHADKPSQKKSGGKPPKQKSSANNRGGNSGHHAFDSKDSKKSYQRDFDNHSRRRNDHGDHDHHSGHRHRHGHSGITISPYGLGFSYSNRDFSFSTGRPPNYLPYYNDYGSQYYSPAPIYGYGNVYGYDSYDPLYGSTQRSYRSGGYDLGPSAVYPSPSYYAPYGQPYSTPESLAVDQLTGEPDQLNDTPLSAAESTAFPVISTKAVALRTQQRAEAAFRAGRYDEAAQLVSQSIRLDDQNGLLYLFAAQTQFAVGDYPEAIQDLETATRLLKTDQWDFVVKNFRKFYGKNDYVSQTNRLSKQIEQRSDDITARVLRGYQYGALGHPAAAAKDFAAVLAHKPEHALTGRLLPVFGNQPPPASTPAKIELPVPPGNLPNSQELPAPDGMEEIATPPRIIKLTPESEESVLELDAP